MKLFIISALIAVSTAARLEHLEAQARGNGPSNQYLPPFGSSGSRGPNSQSSFGSSPGAPSRYSDATINKYLPPFGGNDNSINSFGAEQIGAGAGPFNAATSKQYLAPDHEHGQGSHSQFGQQSAFGRQQAPFGQQQSAFGQQQSGFGAKNGLGSQSGFGSQYQQQGANGQYGQAANGQFGQSGNLGQRGFGSYNQRAQSSQYRPGFQSQQIPVQDFDEETGYHY